MKLFNKNCETCQYAPVKGLKSLGVFSGHADYTVALAGNPNTGKSTIFNALTGLRQHTGNWPGKTVEVKEGKFQFGGKIFRIVDLPGTYSLMAHSEDEEVARNFLFFNQPDVTIVVTDATRLERNLNLVLQILTITDKVVVALNMIDEAEKKGLKINERHLSRKLGVPVVKTNARMQFGLEELLKTVLDVAEGKIKTKPLRINLDMPALKKAVEEITGSLKKILPELPRKEWIAMRLLAGDEFIKETLLSPEKFYHLKLSKEKIKEIQELLEKVKQIRIENQDRFYDLITEQIFAVSHQIIQEIIIQGKERIHTPLEVKIDRWVTHPFWGFLIMFFLLGIVLWITIKGANIPSEFLNNLLLGKIYPVLKELTVSWPSWLSGMLIDGMYLTTAWVVSVMLPPMAIFFPLFTLLEDLGYLPRIAFNLDKIYKKSGAHGKQALTMTMGFGCNAAAVVSTRIIDSPRERLLAIITNNFSLCNGRWPGQILLATIFIGALVPEEWSSLVAMSAVVFIAVLGIGLSFFGSWLLSKTLLRGEVSAFYLELPPYRVPQLWKTIYTSLIDRTLIVLWRAVVFAAPIGIVIWLITHWQIGDETLAHYLIEFLDGPAKWIGLNGIIILAFIVGIPANEIIIPAVLMLTILYFNIDISGINKGVLTEISDMKTLRTVLETGGWTLLTAVNYMIFSLLHNPCSTTIYTIYKETESFKWTVVATFFPLIVGMLVLFFIKILFHF